MNLFEDDLIREYQEWKTANPNSFNWWSYVNLKADLHTALVFVNSILLNFLKKKDV